VPTPKEAGSDSIRLGEIVGRSRERIATSKIGDPELVAEIIEIAAIKRATEIIATSREIGMITPEAARPQLEREREDFFGGE
jgi:hypothetical protein